MTTETRKRIRAYKKMLPELRERVIAVALLLAMSASMLGSASFAWLTLSKNPEVSAASTTIASNGNLEIALATGNGMKVPDESQVGDSSAAEGQGIAKSNITWGNLINLSDSSYGLDSLVLRPAMLNAAELLTSPLWGAEYSWDGRITQMNSNFGYTSWQIDPNVGGRFAVSDDHGVRAVSSMIYDSSSGDAKLALIRNQVKAKNVTAATTYTGIAGKKESMQSLATMMGLYMTARMNPDHADLSNPDVAAADVLNLYSMYVDFMKAMYQEAEAIAAIANYVQMCKHGENNYVAITADQVLGLNGETKLTNAMLKTMGVTISKLTEFQNDYVTISTDSVKLDEIATSGGSLKWKDSGMNDIVNHLVNVGACTIGKDNTPISSIGASNAASYLSGTQEARITNGILYRFEERTGGYLEVKNLSISAKVNRMGMTIPASVKANVQTSAPREYNLFTNDLDTAISASGGSAIADLIAQDTYGLAVDFWVRTNAQGSYLTLEGNLLTETNTVEATIKNIEGEEVPLYTATTTVTDDEGNASEYTQDVYEGKVTILDENGQPQEVDGWLSAETHTAVTLDEGVTPKQKMLEVVTVLGYEGENRIWDGNEAMLSTDATTQGSGSCYVYYADTPEDQARSLKLLEAFNVAFVGADGSLLTTAKMDTERFYAENGRVVVPLKLEPSESIDLGIDLQGNQQYGITELIQNEPTRITAIVYLDGNKLTNKDVLSAADIQGQLNIQFASSGELQPIKNEDLASQSLSVYASVDKTSFDWDSATDDMTSVVTVTVDGAEPSQVEAFFLRAINATQGSREDTMTFTKNAEGKWVSAYKFKAPGNYVLRTVRLDGVDYELKTAPQVEVKGFAVSYVSCDEAENRHISVLSAENASTVNMRMKFATNDRSRMPEKVQGRFTTTDGVAVNVDFTYNATNQEWTGKAKFLTSGEYTMQFLVLDGKYVELDPDYWHTASVTLGMRVEVYTTSPHTFKYLGEEMPDNQKMLHMQVRILDNAGNEMPGYSGVKLTYNMRGSGIKKMDTDLQWNGDYYVGKLANEGPGIWVFNNVTVGNDILTNDLVSPTFTIQSPEPPVYYAHDTKTYQFKLDNTAEMNVQITNSSAASVQALIQKAGSEGVWVNGILGSEVTTTDGKTANIWRFPVPKDSNGYQDGNWTMMKLSLCDVFAADGTAYTAENPLVWDMADKNIATKVVSKLTYSFTAETADGKVSQNFGKDSSGKITGAFLQSYNIPSQTVTISDFEGNKSTKIENVQMTFTYDGGSANNGGYTRTDQELNNATVAPVTVSLSPVDGSTSKFAFTQTDAKKLLYAGNYLTTLSFTVNGNTVTLTGDTLPAGAPTYTVWSVTPSVTVSDVTPETTEEIPTKITYVKKKGTWSSKYLLDYTLTDKTYNSLDTENNEVYAYAKATENPNGGNGDAGFICPTLKFTVAGVDNKSTVKFSIPAGSATVKNISITGNTVSSAITLGNNTTTIENFKGYLSVTYTLYSYKGHGENIQIDTVTIDREGKTYTVYLDKPIKIHNPSSTPTQ